jgi:hypothetical protein
MPVARRWGGRKINAAPYEAYDAVRELIELYGPDRLDRFGKWLDSVDQQLGGEDKFTQFLKLRERLRRDPYDLPKRRIQRGDSAAIVEAILALMRRNPKRVWTTSEFADRFSKSVKAMWHLLSQMSDRGLIEVVDKGLGQWALCEARIAPKKTVSGRMIEKLYGVQEMRWSPLARAIGVDPAAMSTPAQSLRRIGILPPADRHPDPNKRAPLRLTADTRARMDRGEVICDRRGFVLWAPTETGQI